MERTCGTCSLCCKLLPVRELNKAAGERCKHQKFGKGCAIHRKPGYPIVCAGWNCRWLVNDDTADLSRPDRSHYVIDSMPDRIRLDPSDGSKPKMFDVIQIWVDPAFPDAHRDPALRRYLERRAERDHMAALVRFSVTENMAIFAPCLSTDGQWHEQVSRGDSNLKSISEELLAAGIAKISGTFKLNVR